jgi:hypothetical protein
MLLRALPVLFFLGCDVEYVRPQSIGDITTIPRVYGNGSGARMVNDEPFSHRYNYSVGPVLYFNGDARQLWYQDYLDRVDRAERFGYAPPPCPRYTPYEDAPRPRIFGGVFFGKFAR